MVVSAELGLVGAPAARSQSILSYFQLDDNFKGAHVLARSAERVRKQPAVHVAGRKDREDYQSIQDLRDR